MKTIELRRKSEKELNDLLKENYQKLGRFRFDLASKKLKNVSEIKLTKRNIARVSTILKELNKNE